MERDLPIALQNVTTHILRHMVEGIAKFGPLYTTWMFPFERMNSWFTRRVLNRQYPESTIMETYQVPDTQMQGLIQHYNNESILNVAIRLTRVQLNTCFTNITYVSSKSGDRVSIFVYCIKDECFTILFNFFIQVL